MIPLPADPRVWVPADAWCAAAEAARDPGDTGLDLGPVARRARRRKGRAPVIDRATASRAASVAAKIGTKATAGGLHVDPTTLVKAWHRYGITPPGRTADAWAAWKRGRRTSAGAS